jgi:hypothetical protein
MNVQDYNAAGYRLSQLIAQPIIDRAEKDIVTAYIVPLLGRTPTQAEIDAEPLKTAIMSLSFLLVQQRTIAATRAGAKTKNAEQSGTPTPEDVLRENATTCAANLRAVAEDAHKSVHDICGIYFRSNYFSTH